MSLESRIISAEIEVSSQTIIEDILRRSIGGESDGDGSSIRSILGRDGEGF